jgi:FkbM family methyltransferase
MIHKVLQRAEFEMQPPVLIDVGASGGLHDAWKDLAKYSVCVAFDADDREMQVDSPESKAYRKLYIYNRALTADKEGVADFYFTKEPACSSTLAPHADKLAAWEFAHRFAIVQRSTVQTVHLQTALRELKIEHVDWIKIDSQGTDLRLFQSLEALRMRRVLVAEFEPAIMDSYQGEDKLWQLMASMDSLSFWMCDIDVKGSQRIRNNLMGAFRPVERKYLVHLLKSAPGWAEVTYFNAFANPDFRLREYLLGWVCATIKEQHGFALELAITAKERFRDMFCEELEQHSIRSIRRRYWNLPAYLPLLGRVYRKWRKGKRHGNPAARLATIMAASSQPMPRGDARD